MKSMSNVDIYTVSNELNNLLSGARVDKSFQPTKDIVNEIPCSWNRKSGFGNAMWL